MDERYNDYGGGYANLDLYLRLLQVPDTPAYLLYAEGTFHQFHGGVTTGTGGDALQRIASAIQQQDRAIHGSDRTLPNAVPILLGAPHPAVRRFMRHSVDAADAG
jgi:hypothetical protein